MQEYSRAKANASVAWARLDSRCSPSPTTIATTCDLDTDLYAPLPSALCPML